MYFISSSESLGSLMSIQYRHAPSSVRRPLSVHHFQRSSPKTAAPIKAKFHMKPQWDGETKFCSRGLGHMAKMAAMTI